MLTPRKEDVLHKAWMLRLLTAICGHSELSQKLAFKGGTCAAMRGFLNRFSIDLDFDLVTDTNETKVVKKIMKGIFADLKLEIKDQSRKVPQYFLKYPAKDASGRNTIKIDISYPPPKANLYESVRLPEIDRIVLCQTLETMVANKLVALISRYEKNGKIAGRDIYDVHEFLMQGFDCNEKVILELRKMSVSRFLSQLADFVEKHVTTRVIDEDLNYLLPNKEFQAIRKVLKAETIMLLRQHAPF
ncbi:nucleotidyl transferase AbiEii/AbiGii toxin family protein [Candidatus Peregrinibacteria bacterium]|nr:nucleotidyl transferase AbiEii/AbiGii toxin family protein [Candidatus Peregrinibacteria bacterium]